MQPQLSLIEFQALMSKDNRMDYIVDQMKISKIIGTKEALETVERIVNFFDRQETFLISINLNVGSRNEKMLTKKLKNIACNNNVTQFDSNAQADYLSSSEKKDDEVLLKIACLEENFNKLFNLISSQNKQQQNSIQLLHVKTNRLSKKIDSMQEQSNECKEIFNNEIDALKQGKIGIHKQITEMHIKIREKIDQGNLHNEKRIIQTVLIILFALVVRFLLNHLF
jgi:hypothetical protein